MRKANQIECTRYIYLITNLVNGKTYIGQHSVRSNRDDYYGSGKLIKRAIKKYGLCNFRKEILFKSENISVADISEVEKYYIALARMVGKAEYNISSGGESWEIASQFANNIKQRDKAREHIIHLNRTYWSEHRDKNLENLRNGNKVANSRWKDNYERKQKLADFNRTNEKRKLALKNNPNMSKSKVGKHWFSNGVVEVFQYNCPDGFKQGRLSKIN